MSDDRIGDSSFADVDPAPTASTTERIDLGYGDMRLQGLVGHGGNAVVHEVTAPEGQRMALKRPHVENERVRERFESEAETWSHLAHRFIVRIHAWGVDPEPWIAMGFADEGSLADRTGEMRIDEALWTSIAIAEGVRYAHERGVMHYDLKPENVLLCSTPDGEWSVPKVTDWGLAELLLTQDGKPRGLTYPYAAPEQFERGTTTDSATDIYQLGATVYALLTGRPPVTGSQSEVVRKCKEGAWPAPTSVNEGLPKATDSVLKKALATDPGDRYENVLLFRRALESLFRDVFVPTDVSHVGVTPRRTNTLATAGPTSAPDEEWKTTVDSNPVESFVVGDGRLYFAGNDGTLFAIDVPSGSTVAEETLPQRSVGCPSFVGDEVRLLTAEPSLVRLDPESLSCTGRRILESVPRSSHLLVGTELFYTTNRRRVVASSIEGERNWTANLPGNPGGQIASTETSLVIPTYRGTVCLDRQRGRKQWQTDVGAPHRTTPAVSSDAIVVPGDGVVAEFDLSSGRERWRTSTSGTVTGVAMTDDAVFVGTSEGTLSRLVRSDGTIRWRQRLKGRSIGPPVVAGGTVYVGCQGQDGRTLPKRMDGVFGFDAESGSDHWAVSPGDDVLGPVLPVGEKVVIVRTDGAVVAVT